MTTFAKPAAVVMSNLFTRPADTTAYASGDLIANSVTAGAVVALTFAAALRQPGYKAIVRRVGLRTNQALLANGTFRLHLFALTPTVTGGDNAPLDVANLAAAAQQYLGYVADIGLSIIGTGQGARGWSVGPAQEIGFTQATTAALFGLLEARAAYVPTSGQTFQAMLEIAQY